MQTYQSLLETPPGYASERIARFLWQLDEQSRRLLEDVHDIRPDELGWQPAPGMNTIGMLLAHIGYAEAHIAQVGLLGEATGHAHDVVGITDADEGMPLAAGASPPAALQGKDLIFFDEILWRARNHTRKVAVPLVDADLERIVTRARPDGTRRVFNVGWVFYHMLEHEAGHQGQIVLLRHLYRLRQGADG